MNKEIDNKYINILIEVLNNCEISNIDKEIEEANLFIGKSKIINKSIKTNSNYIRILNKFDFNKLNEEEINNINDLSNIEDKKLFIKNTLKKVTNINNDKPIIIEPIALNKKIPSGVLVLELVIGKNTKEMNKEEFINNINEQKLLLEKLKKKYIERLTQLLNYPVIIYINKSL